MIQLPAKLLPERAARYLRKFQQEIDKLPLYSDRVATGKKKFESRNKTTNKTFQAVRNTLSEMCSGAQRCCYCEDSLADEVEHIRPKDFYPEQVFVWENYVYACGPCNGPKKSKFAIIAGNPAQLVNITRKKGDPVEPPLAGLNALIDPRCENPLDYLELDLLGTFYFLPRMGLNNVDTLRAEYTNKVLRLNDRDPLVKARREYYNNYLSRLDKYIRHRDSGEQPIQLEVMKDAIQRMGHPTVWREMQRQHTLIPELNQLFTQAPEALNW
jgi:uncharacterized protein (TIGR02646 family)